MAMNKAEQAAMREMHERAALAWPRCAEPECARPEEEIGAGPKRTGVFRGWWMIPGRDLGSCVGEGVSEGSTHATEPYTDEQLATRYRSGSRLSFSQGAGGPWYHTEADALRAYHWARAKRYAAELAAIERRLADLP